MIRPILATLSLIALCACGGTEIQNVPVGDVQVAQIPSGAKDPKTPNGQLTGFIIFPVADRPLTQRIAIIQQYLEQQGKCTLGTTDSAQLAAYTRSIEGTDLISLYAPIKC